jgi:polysaccharide pyruvyl transferase WcaK-like protein
MLQKIDLDQSEQALTEAKAERQAMLDATLAPFDTAWYLVRDIRQALASYHRANADQAAMAYRPNEPAKAAARAELVAATMAEAKAKARQIPELLTELRGIHQTDTAPPTQVSRKADAAGIEAYTDAAYAVLLEYVDVRGLFEVDIARIDGKLNEDDGP